MNKCSPRRFFIASCSALALTLLSPISFAQNTISRVKFDTTQGNFTVEVDSAKAPITVANFLRYVEKKYYDGTIFHRVIPGFMIQGGGFDKDMKQKDTDKPIVIESKNGLKNSVGTLAMARTMDPNSATSQFFINVADNGMLDYPGQDGHGYAVFGKVTEGMDVVMKIVGVPSGSYGGHQNVPKSPVIITKAALVSGDAANAKK